MIFNVGKGLVSTEKFAGLVGIRLPDRGKPKLGVEVLELDAL